MCDSHTDVRLLIDRITQMDLLLIKLINDLSNIKGPDRKLVCVDWINRVIRAVKRQTVQSHYTY